MPEIRLPLIFPTAAVEEWVAGASASLTTTPQDHEIDLRLRGESPAAAERKQY
jgi:hypothetical protein